MKTQSKRQAAKMAQSNASVETALAKEELRQLRCASLPDLRKAAVDLSFEERKTVFAGALDLDIEDEEKAYLAVAQRIFREERGMDTPVEAFLTNLIAKHGASALLRADIHSELDEFEDNWRDALRIARKFYRENTLLVTADEVPPAEDTDASEESALAIA